MDALPASLRAYVVDQRYDDYRSIDHEVWERVIGRIGARLSRTAHASYVHGFSATGMERTRIPRVDAMSDRLAAFGWSAACVDGFIPPRAFQAFQARRILPIARDVRSVAHLAYTPAPDILHEAAGHAPMLVDPEYAAFAQRIGEMGRVCFTLPCDDEAFFAVRALSIGKEDERSSPEALAAAESRVARSMRGELPVSEAHRLARLYWWTIEYGLFGAASSYRLYGAGLLSSLGESESCHDASVRKIPIDARCADVAYDITRPQPHLFVTPSFAALSDVLDEVMSRTAYRRGGLEGIRTAIASGEVATLRFDGGATLDARLTELVPGDPPCVRAIGPVRAQLDARDAGRRFGRAGEQLTVDLAPSGATLTLASGEQVRLPRTSGQIVSCHPAHD